MAEIQITDDDRAVAKEKAEAACKKYEGTANYKNELAMARAAFSFEAAKERYPRGSYTIKTLKASVADDTITG